MEIMILFRWCIFKFIISTEVARVYYYKLIISENLNKMYGFSPDIHPKSNVLYPLNTVYSFNFLSQKRSNKMCILYTAFIKFDDRSDLCSN